MKKIIFLMFVFAGVLFAKTEVVELTGEYAKELANPFKEVFNENKENDITVVSLDKDVELKVESNLTQDIYTRNAHPEKIVLKNKSVEKVSKLFYSEDYNVVKDSKGVVEVNVLGGTVDLEYMERDFNMHAHLTTVNIELKVEIKRDGKSAIKTIKMDEKLGRDGANYNLSLTVNDVKKLKNESLEDKIKKIIETEIFVVLKEI